jgi:predicted regulator of Ras-like GTPase activity (Roadblock/LC7/MglB family)
MALVGNLKDLRLPSLIQLNCMERNTAKMTIEYGNKYGFIYFDDGQVVHAEFDPDMGEKAVFRLLTLDEGKFKVEGGIRAPIKSINTSWTNLLLEGLHKIDSSVESDEQRFRFLLEKIFTVRGVRLAELFNLQGERIASSEKDEDLDDMGNTYALNLFEANAAGEYASLGNPEFTSIATGQIRHVLIPYEGEFVLVIKLDVKVKLDLVLDMLKKAIS